MDKEHAVSILEATLFLDSHINELVRRVETLPNQEEKNRLCKAIGDVMGLLARHITFPIVNQYPDLDPDKK